MENKQNYPCIYTNRNGYSTMTTLYPYQKKGVRLIQQFDGKVLLADEMGLGKSLQALAYLKISKNYPAVVICPSSAKWVWKNEARKHLNMASKIIEGQTVRDIKNIHKYKLIIINYDILIYWLDYLKQINPQLIIIDEVHLQKNRKAKRTKAIQQLTKGKKHIIAISGTPLLNRPSELFTTLKLLWPYKFYSFWNYAFRYCKPFQSRWGWNFNGAENLEELHGILKQIGMIRRLKADVLKELPDKIRTVVQLPICKKSEYYDAVNNFLDWLGKQDPNKAERAARAEKLVKIGYLKRLAAKLKMKYVIQWVENFLEDSNEKLVLFCCHKNIIKRLQKHFPKNSVFIDGSVKSKDRDIAVQKFQTDPSVRLFFGNIKAAGEVITLTAAATLAFVELDFVPAKHAQAEDRIHRIGQKSVTNFYYLVAKGTIEEHLCEIIQEKQKVISAVLDGDDSINTINVYDLLERTLIKGKINGTIRQKS